MTASPLIPVKTRDDVEIERLMTTIQTKRAEVAEMTLALEYLKREVHHFEGEYNARVGALYLTLDKVNLATKEYQLRFRLLQEGISDTDIEARVEACFRSERERLASYDSQDGEPAEKPESRDETPELPKDRLKQLRKLYVRLAKMYHPDKSNAPEEQQTRKQVMALINRAYEDRDIQTLQRMDVDLPPEDEFAAETALERKQRLIQEMNRLMRSIGELRLEINRTKSSRTYKLKQEVEASRENGRDLLANLARDLQRKINAHRRRLVQFADAFRKFASRRPDKPKARPVEF
jgi:hypothetical protein